MQRAGLPHRAAHDRDARGLVAQPMGPGVGSGVDDDAVVVDRRDRPATRAPRRRCPRSGCPSLCRTASTVTGTPSSVEREHVVARGLGVAALIEHRADVLDALHRRSVELQCGCTPAVEDELVRLDPEAARRQAAEVAGAGLDLEHRVAHATVEVMVVPLAGALVAVGAAGQLDGAQPTLLDQPPHVAVHGGDPELRDLLAREAQALGWGRSGDRRDRTRRRIASSWQVRRRLSMRLSDSTQRRQRAVARAAEDPEPRSSSATSEIERDGGEHDRRLGADRRAIDGDRAAP